MHAYFFAWNALHPEEPAQGVLANVLYKLKVPDFKTFIVRPTEQDRTTLVQYLQGARALSQHSMLSAWPNKTNCKSFNRTCPHLLSGACAAFEGDGNG